MSDGPPAEPPPPAERREPAGASPSPTPSPGQRAALAVWLAVLCAVLVHLWYFGLLRRVGENWPPFVLLGLVGLMMAGVLGSGVGLPSLFRNDPDATPAFFDRSFLSGAGVALLTLTVWTVVFYCEFLNRAERTLPFEAEYANRDKVGYLWPIRDQGEIVLGGWAYVLAWFLLLGAAPTFVLFGLCVAFPTAEVRDRRRPGGARDERKGYLRGAAAMTVAGSVLLGAGLLLAGTLNADPAIQFIDGNGLGWWTGAVRNSSEVHTVEAMTNLLEREGRRAAERKAEKNGAEEAGQKAEGERVAAAVNEARPPALKAAKREAVYIIYSMLTFIALFAIVYSLILESVTVLSPGLGICLVFSLLALAYLLLTMLAPALQFLAVVVGLAVFARLNSNPHKYQIPGMGDHYAKLTDLAEADHEAETGPVPQPTPLLLNDRTVLQKWKARLPKNGKKPKLVLVAVSGGAYRASFWTTIVLDELARNPGLPGFLNHIRLMTGASGGMVGAAYAAALLEPPLSDAYSPVPRITDQLACDTGRDSLTPIVRRIVRRELLRSLLPVTQKYDRGRSLEDEWKTLNITVESLRKGEEDGWRPSLVFSPMIVETGRQLLISNLDLYGLTDTRGRPREGVSYEAATDAPPAGNAGRYSRPAVEFFRAFQGTYKPASGDGFLVKTAARLNATFPYLSPAVSLPVTPARRVVDAGYYDNYGINVALAWAYHNRKWIRDETSGLGLVQIRAFESELARKQLWGSGGGSGRLFEWLQTGTQALTTPPEAGYNALTWSMSFRNDEQLCALDDYLNAPPPHTGAVRGRMFETFVFENPIPFGMNWFVTSDEIARMRDSLAENAPGPLQNVPAHNPQEIVRMVQWWKS